MTGDFKNFIRITNMSGTFYVVKQGDTLTSIAMTFYGCTAYCYWIALVNNIYDVKQFVPGVVLFIPDSRLEFGLAAYDKWRTKNGH